MKKIFCYLFMGFPLMTAAQLLSASNCNPTPNYPLECQGVNVTENFNTGPGSFSSDFFTWDKKCGCWKATRIRMNQTFYITSGIYKLNQDGIITVGFSYEGSHRRDLYILDALTGEVLTACAAVAGSWGNRDQVCNMIPIETDKEKFTKGRLIRFKVKYMTFSYPLNGTAVFDNFSTAGTATLQTISTTKMLPGRNSVLIENPVFSTLKIHLAPVDQPYTIQVLNLQGQVIRQTIIPAGKVLETIDMGGQKSGVYLISVSTPQGQTIVQKFVKTQ